MFFRFDAHIQNIRKPNFANTNLLGHPLVTRLLFSFSPTEFSFIYFMIFKKCLELPGIFKAYFLEKAQWG